MHVITIANKKGGVAKTTTAITMEAILREKNKKVLHIDADPQCNGTDTYKAKTNGVPTLYDAMIAPEKYRLPLSECVQTTEIGDIIAGDKQMIDAEKILTSELDGVFRLKDKLEEFIKTSNYDYIIIDTAPTEGSLLYNCMIASDELIIPTTADRYGMQSVASFMDAIYTIKNKYHHDLWVAGVLITRYNKQTKISRSIRPQLIKMLSEFDIDVFDNVINEGVKVREAATLRTTLWEYAKESIPAQNYKDFVEEFLDKEEKHYEQISGAKEQ